MRLTLGIRLSEYYALLGYSLANLGWSDVSSWNDSEPWIDTVT